MLSRYHPLSQSLGQQALVRLSVEASLALQGPVKGPQELLEAVCHVSLQLLLDISDCGPLHFMLDLDLEDWLGSPAAVAGRQLVAVFHRAGLAGPNLLVLLGILLRLGLLFLLEIGLLVVLQTEAIPEDHAASLYKLDISRCMGDSDFVLAKSLLQSVPGLLP